MINIQNLSHYYNRGEEDEILALSGIDLQIASGEFVCLIGPNGSGKSTLARFFNGLLLPEQGVVRIGELDTRKAKDLIPIRRQVGMVFQNPDSQLVGTMVEEEVAFGLENLGVSRELMKNRISDALKAVRLDAYPRFNPINLSGGQKQRLTIASVLAMEPQYIILDEPTSMLDPLGKKEVFETISRLNRERGITVIFITHDLEEAALFKRVIALKEGKIVLDGSPDEIFSQVDKLLELNLDAPRIPKLFYDLKNDGLPLKIACYSPDQAAGELAKILIPLAWNRGRGPVRQERDFSGELIRAENLSHIYMPDTPFKSIGIENITNTVSGGEILGIVGGTGSGKSTLIQHFNGILKPSSGKISAFDQDLSNKKTNLKKLREKIGLLFQFPESQLFAETVFADVAYGPRNMGVPEKEVGKRVQMALNLMGLNYELANRNPFSLSGGEMRQVAMAGVLALGPEVLVMDEPFAGIDPPGKSRLLNQLLTFNREHQITIVLVSHELDELGELADNILVLKEGKTMTAQPLRMLFSRPELLEEAGLPLPVYPQLMAELNKNGIPVSREIFSREEARREILRFFKSN